MKITYVLPFYNASAIIAQTIESILGQQHKDFDIIAIDDRSDDFIQPLKEHYKEIIWITLDKRSGAAYCRNKGNEMATGEVIACCDAGDIYLPARGSEIEKIFSSKQFDIVYSHVQVNSPSGHGLYTQEAVTWSDQLKPPISHPTVAYKKVVAEKIKYHEGCLDTDFYEFFMYDAKRAGYEFGTINRILCMKFDLTDASSYRDVKKAKDEKFKKYQEYGIKIERQNV